MRIVSSIFPSEELQKEIRDKFPEVFFEFYKGMANAEEAFYDCEVFMTYGDDLTEHHIEKANQLKWIMVMSAGLEKMPLERCREKGIMITNARGIHKIPMAEFTLGFMLQWVKRMNELLCNEENSQWNRKVPMEELCDKSILILGTGAIGGEIARLAKAFRMNTLGVNRTGKNVEHIDRLYSMSQLIDVLPEADFIVSVLPSTHETKHLLTKAHFEEMKSSAVFINIGRGDLIEESVLLEVLNENLISHVYLDVFEKEPLGENHPFWKMENVTVTPHISSISKKYLPRCFVIFEQNLHTYINKRDEFINYVDPIKGY